MFFVNCRRIKGGAARSAENGRWTAEILIFRLFGFLNIYGERKQKTGSAGSGVWEWR